MFFTIGYKRVYWVESPLQKNNEKLTRIEKQVEIQQKRTGLCFPSSSTVEQQTSKTFHELDELGRKKVFGKVTLAEQDFKEVISLAKEGVLSRGKIHTFEQQAQKVTARVSPNIIISGSSAIFPISACILKCCFPAN